MSRSKRKTPIRGITTAETEKQDKIEANRKLRKLNRMKIRKNDFDFFQLREVSNVWGFNKDGKKFLKNPTRNDLMK